MQVLHYDQDKYEPSTWFKTRFAHPAFVQLQPLNAALVIQVLEHKHPEYTQDIPLMLALHEDKGAPFERWFNESSLTQHLRQDLRFARTCALWSTQVIDWNAAYAQDTAIVLHTCRSDPSALLRAPQEWRDDVRYVTAFAKLNGDCLNYLPAHWRSDPQVMFECIVNNNDLCKETVTQLRYLAPELREDPSFMERLSVALVKTGRTDALDQFPEHLRAQASFMLPLVQIEPASFAYASGALKDDRAFVALAAEQQPGVLGWASARLRSDIVFMYECTQGKMHGAWFNLIGPSARKVRALEAQGVSVAQAFVQVAQKTLAERQRRVLREALAVKGTAKRPAQTALSRSL